MFNTSQLLDCLSGLVGFEPSYSSDFPDIDKDLTASSSGLVVGQGLHALLKQENILSVAEQFATVQVRVYDPVRTYRKGELVQVASAIYESLQDTNLNHAPAASAAYWRPSSLYSAFLRRTYNNAVLKLANRLFTEKKLSAAAKTVLGSMSLYEGVGNLSSHITKDGRVVGLKITPVNEDTAAVLTYIGLQFTQAQNAFPLYLYHSSSDQPLQVIPIDQTKAVQFQWTKLPTEVRLSFLNDTVPGGGSYYLCYYEQDLAGEAINKEISWTGRNVCGTCSEGIVNRQAWEKWSSMVQIQPFYVSAGNIDYVGKTFWDETDVILGSNMTFGINLQLSVVCDVTRLFCQHRLAVADALSRQILVDLLSEFTFSLRDNQKVGKAAGMAAVALDNQEGGQYGEAKKLENAIKALSFDLGGLSPVCLPCSGSGRYKQKTVF